MICRHRPGAVHLQDQWVSSDLEALLPTGNEGLYAPRYLRLNETGVEFGHGGPRIRFQMSHVPANICLQVRLLLQPMQNL